MWARLQKTGVISLGPYVATFGPDSKKQGDLIWILGRRLLRKPLSRPPDVRLFRVGGIITLGIEGGVP